MAKIIHINQKIEIQLDYLREKYKDDDVLAPYSRVIQKALKRAKMWDESLFDEKIHS